MDHPYTSLPARAFWRTAVADRHHSEIDDLWHPKFAITEDSRIATFGSCFAQHMGRELRARGFDWVEKETAPPQFSDAVSMQYGYRLFSARTGNIYTARGFRQWVEWAFRKKRMPREVWQDGDRFHDPFRPAIEPKGFRSRDELYQSRKTTLVALRRGLRSADVLIFTLGLTEAWQNLDDGCIYPMCPGTVAGSFEAGMHRFRNFSFAEVLADLEATLTLLRDHNAAIKLLLTVSPVPLTATAGGDHVLSATSYSKSVLRAVAGELAQAHEHVDYFPSYEIINAHPFRGTFFGPNLRSVSQQGVRFVIDGFFGSLEQAGHVAPAGAKAAGGFQRARSGGAPPAATATVQRERGGARLRESGDDLVCEEQLLDAFGRSE